jgi:uncharacterized protein YndB with AHSA1/START domain
MNSIICYRTVVWAIFLFAGLIIARAEVIDSSAIGFIVKQTIVIAADTNDVYRALVANVGEWWDSAHTFSGNAHNLSIDDRAGGCFCEKLENGGSVRHLEVVFAAPGKTLRMRGALGPLQSMAVTGSMTWVFSKAGTGTKLEVMYTVGGYRLGGLQTMAPLVDKVLFEQIKRLKEYVEKKK